jgi:hypothetical protein
MSKTKKYAILKPRKLLNKYGEKIIVRFILNEKSKFPGVVVDVNNFEFKEDTKEPKNNAELKYTVVKIPTKRKYDNLEDSDKEIFEKEIEDVFLDILTNSLKNLKSLEEQRKDKKK